MKFLKEIWLWLPVIIQMGLVWFGAYLIYGLVKWLLELVFPDKQKN